MSLGVHVIETELYTALTADTTVNAAVTGRVYPLIMPQNPTFPAITYERISSNKVNGLAGYLGMDNAHIMLNIWATRYDTAKELAEDVHDCMNKVAGFRSLLINDMDGYDPDTQLFVVSQDYSCWNAA
jgi:hypothetical protein